MTTYFIQASLASHFQDYYIDANTLEEAMIAARTMYAEDFDIQRGMRGFIQVAI